MKGLEYVPTGNRWLFLLSWLGIAMVFMSIVMIAPNYREFKTGKIISRWKKLLFAIIFGYIAVMTVGTV